MTLENQFQIFIFEKNNFLNLPELPNYEEK